HPRPRQPLVVALGVLAPLLLVLGIWLGGHPDRLPGPVRDALVGDSDARTVDRALDEVHGEYYRPLPRGALVDAALGGIVRSLHDRFSSYFTAREYRDFQESTDAQFSGVGLTAREDPRGLRGDGGGLVEEARLVASIFIPEGPIVSTRGRAQPARTLMAAGGAIAKDIPVVVLVDGETASAAEIVTGALQDRHRAAVVGRHTFGKGVFQEVTTLPNGGALDLTVG